MNRLQYYSHICLTHKYSFIIKFLIIFAIYSLFYLDNIQDIAYCAKKSGLKKSGFIQYLENTAAAAAAVPAVAESKDEIIQVFQEQIRNLQIENKSLRDTIVSSFQETQDLQRAQLEELQKLRTDTLINVAQPVIAEPIAEAKFTENTVPAIDQETLINNLRQRCNDSGRRITEMQTKFEGYIHEYENKTLALLEAKQKLEHELYLNRHPNYRTPRVPLDRFPQGYVPYISGGVASDESRFGYHHAAANYMLIEPPTHRTDGGIERMVRQPYGSKPDSRYLQEIYYAPNSAGNGYKPNTYESTTKGFAESTEEYNRKRGIR